MRITIAVGIACISLMLASPRAARAQATPPDRAKDAALIRAEIERICQAFVDKDRATLTATHGKDWRGFTPGSDHVIRGLDGYMNEATFEPGRQRVKGWSATDSPTSTSSFTATRRSRLSYSTSMPCTATDKGGQKLDDPRRVSQGAERLDPGRVEHVAASGRNGAADVTARGSWEMGSARHCSPLAKRCGARGSPATRTRSRSSLPPNWSRSIRLRYVRHAHVEPRGLPRLRRLRRQADAPRLSQHRVPGVRQHGDPLHDLRDGSRIAAARRRTERGIATEVFVKQNGQWLNTGWQLAPVPAGKPKAP